MNDVQNTNAPYDYNLILVLGIPYFTISAGLYHIAYWSTFDINGLAFIGIADLIKSFVYPFSTFFIIVPLNILLAYYTLEKTGFLPSGGGRDSQLGKKLNHPILQIIAFALWLVFLCIFYRQQSPYKWFLLAYFSGLLPSLMLDHMGFLAQRFSDNNIRINLIRLLVYIPLFSFASGKYNSENIHANLKYQFIASKKKDMGKEICDTTKIIGITEKYVFLCNMKNENLTMIRIEKMDTIKFLIKE